MAGARPPRAAQCLRADLDADRPRTRPSARRHRRDRDRVHAAGARPPAGRFDLRPRLPGGAGLPAVHCGDLCGGQPDRRPLLSAVRSAGVCRMRMRANTAIGGLLISVLIGTAVTAAFWTPFDPLRVNLRARLQPPSALYWLGTDEFGRDVLSRTMAGAGTSVTVALLTVAFAVVIGAALGVITGYMRGWTDRAIMAVNDALLAFPGILLALAVMIVVGANKFGIVLALGLAYVPSVVRVVRGTVLSIREKEYIEASRVIGNSEVYSMLRHVLPNSLAPVAVLATSMFGWVLLAESALSFLGLGVPPPAPTWGNLLAASRPYMESAAWLSIAPGICIALTLLGINLLGDSLRDRLDPRMAHG